MIGYLPKLPVFSSMPLQSGIFSINKKFIIGLVSSIITAAMGYGIRFILLNYLEYDVFTNLDNWIVSLSYFCSLGGIRFVINEYLKENIFLMSYCGGPMPVSNNTAVSGSLPVGNNAAGYNSSMQAPNNSGTGSSSADDVSSRREFLKLQESLRKVERKIEYFEEQLEGANQDLKEAESKRHDYVDRAQAEERYKNCLEAHDAAKDCYTNLVSENRMYEILKKKLENGDYSTSGNSSITKRRFSDCSMANDDSSAPTNKRTSDNQ